MASPCCTCTHDVWANVVRAQHDAHRAMLKKQLWIWPIVAVVLLAIVGYAVSSLIHRTMEGNLRSELQTLLTVEQSMLERWIHVQESSATTLANNPEVRKTVAQLLEAEGDSDLQPETNAPATGDRETKELKLRLEKQIEPAMSAHDFVGFVVADKDLRVIAADTPDMIGKVVPQYENFLIRTLIGKPTVCAPYPERRRGERQDGALRTGSPTMFACAPIRDDNFQVVAVLAMRIRPEKEFTDILQLGRIGETGETYAINKDGLMVSNSRFDDQLIKLGLLPDDDNAASILTIQVRDPGGDMTEGFRPEVRRRELPLTKVAAAAVAGTSGVTMETYRGYRGAPKVGAWTWLPNYDMGIITEISTTEAFHAADYFEANVLRVVRLARHRCAGDFRLHADCRPVAASGAKGGGRGQAARAISPARKNRRGCDGRGLQRPTRDAPPAHGHQNAGRGEA